MAIEIERKFLLQNDDWREAIQESLRIQQAYFFQNPQNSVRLRLEGDHANLNIKSGTLGIQRKEFEYTIPFEDAREMLDLCMKPFIDKIRHLVKYDDRVWEIDEFLGENQGLVVAEIELDHEQQEFSWPPWLGKEVSHDPAYYNVSLVRSPYSSW